MNEKKRYLLTEEEFWRIHGLCESLTLVIEKIILSRELPRIYDWKHPAIAGFENEIREELERSNDPPSVKDYFGF